MTKQLTNLGSPTFTYTKGGVYYYSRRVPSDLRNHYSKPRIVQSLRTKSPAIAEKASLILTSRLEEYWLNLRVKMVQIPAAHLLTNVGRYSSSNLPDIRVALDEYLRLKGEGRDKYFYALTNRNVGYLIEHLGIRPLDLYSTADAAKLRDKLKEKALSPSTIKRIFSTIKSVINLCINENGLAMNNPFSGIYLPNSIEVKTRHPVSSKNIVRLISKCYEIDDDLRWLVALLIDSGMRLSEGAGLVNDDLVLDSVVPHINLVPHPHRSLKTANSARKIPLVGVSLWAAKQVKANSAFFCFPRYTSESGCNRNSASAASNKWIKKVCKTHIVIHGLRHSFRDRLRAVQAPVDIIDQLGGWSYKSIGETYGDGYQLDVLNQWMQKIETT
ncbi:MAG: tyrosine-type recombinase/integrase [Gammaproteobacteria bacterium]|nr:tyrosine-type recombinase/integrase [Gammaproteobacteria bacterium]MBT3859830.1 tyrosine-type recombinase/integrase [Gammaproteobacteria bacterium]MBT3988840.1 tyrosine-type recombinase/integrase [Gammaproteobacteria bacterium]MBT4580874.1 tyrosine-type recombinase/integrase [Gammaproteobacteria bacterium]MBT4660204.1 tyrosine-type recombinase/integrase [Gammaproteobacteria bacterium]